MKFLSKLSRNNRERAIVLHYLTHYAAGLQGFAFAPQEQKFASRAVIGLDLLARELNLTEMVRPAKVRMLKRQLPWFARELSVLAVATPANDGWEITDKNKDEFMAAAKMVIHLVENNQPIDPDLKHQGSEDWASAQ